MKSLWFVLFLNIAKNLAAPSQEVVPRIVGGEDCDVKQYPFIVVVLTKMLCGGTLLKMDFVLTAAHCAEAELLSSTRSLVRAGYTYGSDLTQTRLIDKAYLHEDYDPELLDTATELRFDIALIKLKKPFDLSEVAQLVTLPTKGTAMKCEKILAAGIGKTNYTEEGPQSAADVFSRHLKCVELKVIPNDECKKHYELAVILDDIICTVDEGKDTCVGDSGGPILCDGVQVGIVSYGPTQCGETDQPGTYTKVEKYLDWITEHLKPKKKKSFFHFGFRRQKIPSKGAYTKELSTCITLFGIITHIILH